MAGGVNKVILVGNLGADPDMRYTPSGQGVCELRVATSESWNDKNGQRQERTEWHRIVVWGKRAEMLLEVSLEGPAGLRRGPDPDPQVRRQRRQQALHHRDHRERRAVPRRRWPRRRWRRWRRGDGSSASGRLRLRRRRQAIWRRRRRRRRRPRRRHSVLQRPDATPALWANADFLRLWSAQAISAFGSRITRTALPIIAVKALGEPESRRRCWRRCQLAPGVVSRDVLGRLRRSRSQAPHPDRRRRRARGGRHRRDGRVGARRVDHRARVRGRRDRRRRVGVVPDHRRRVLAGAGRKRDARRRQREARGDRGDRRDQRAGGRGRVDLGARRATRGRDRRGNVRVVGGRCSAASAQPSHAAAGAEVASTSMWQRL